MLLYKWRLEFDLDSKVIIKLKKEKQRSFFLKHTIH